MQIVQTAVKAGKVALSLDSANGILVIRPECFFTPENVARSFEQLRTIRASRFAGQNRMRVLVDRRGTVVQSAETAEKLRACTNDFYLTGDRVAVLVETSLAKMQLRRVLDCRIHAFFISECAAYLWLKAADLGRRDLDQPDLIPGGV